MSSAAAGPQLPRVDFVEFTEAVRRLGLYWLITNQAPPV